MTYHSATQLIYYYSKKNWLFNIELCHSQKTYAKNGYDVYENYKKVSYLVSH